MEVPKLRYKYGNGYQDLVIVYDASLKGSNSTHNESMICERAKNSLKNTTNIAPDSVKGNLLRNIFRNGANKLAITFIFMCNSSEPNPHLHRM